MKAKRVLAAAIGLAVRYTLDIEFRTTPMDYLVILIVLAFGLLAGGNHGQEVIGGMVVTEQVFALPGIGRLVVQGILARDYPLVQGTMLLFGFAFVLINILVDIIYTFVDPRVRYG